jgi:hypothetical protein
LKPLILRHSSNTFEEPFQIDELAISSFDLENSTHTTLKQINVLFRDQEFILEAIKSLDYPQL